ncbi:MAG: GMC family oxidoreductase [Aquabacterium sp.]
MDFDHIIVGAGTAGSVLAERLSASGKHRVLLIEAGGKPSNPFVKIPAGFARLFGSSVDWAFESEPGATTDGRRILVPRGKMLGGSSNMNAQIHQWCHPEDFDGWVAAGAEGWGWRDVAPVFQAQESWSGPNGTRPRGHTGPMRIAPNVNHHPLSASFVAAAQAVAGHEAASDYNGGPYEGAWVCQLAHDRGRRFSAYDAYLKPALARANLQVLTDAQVTKVVVESGRAVGVALRRGGTEQVYRAGAGVVLAAGAFGSPHLLAHSGIGPAAALLRFGIPVVVDAPEVGANLQDHPTVPMVFDTARTDTLKNAESPLSLLRYLLLKHGMLATNAIEAFAFARSGLGREAAPDIELLFGPFEWRNQGREPPRRHAFTIGPIVAAPRSRGRVSLRSADPLQAPGIDFGLLSDPDDIDAKVLLAAIRLARNVAARMGAPDHTGEALPGAGVKSDAELRAWLNGVIQTVYHPTSTCRMGADGRSVVTPRLRVRGVDGLWVADASVMPAVPRGHTNAAVAMIAQRAADWISSGRD